MGRYNRLSIHYGYNFNILNTFKMGLFKKLCSHIPSKMDPSRPPGTNMLVSFELGDANFSHHPTRHPNASQWNIGCVGSQMQNSGVGHVHFMFFVLISFVSGSQREPLFQ